VSQAVGLLEGAFVGDTVGVGVGLPLGALVGEAEARAAELGLKLVVQRRVRAGSGRISWEHRLGR